MAIRSKPKTGAVDTFIKGAPDAAAPKQEAGEVYAKGIKKGNKRQITLTIEPELLRKVDEISKSTGQSRAGLINLAIWQALEGDIFK